MVRPRVVSADSGRSRSQLCHIWVERRVIAVDASTVAGWPSAVPGAPLRRLVLERGLRCVIDEGCCC